MSIIKREHLFGIGFRLREERERLGFTQVDFGHRIGVTDRTMKKYESDETSPRATDLQSLMEEGADVFYILTGERAPRQVREDHSEYLTPARDLAEKIASMKLSTEDADIVYAIATRLSSQNK